MRVKLLHCGDLHLDAPFTSLSDAEGRPGSRRQELKKALAAIAELAREQRVDLILICGDLYEQGYTRRSTIQFIFDQFLKIRDIPVLLIPGNHDPAASDSYYCMGGWPSNVTILGEGSNIYFEHPSSGTRVYGCIPTEDGMDDRRINILMLHGTLDMPFSTDAFQPVMSEELDASGFDYCALGHFHSRICGAGAKRRIYNAGSPEPLGFDEEGEHGVFVVTVEKQQGGESSIQAEFKSIGTRHFINLQVQAGDCLSDEQVAARVAQAMKNAGGSEDLFRIFLKGYISRDFRIDTDYTAELLKTEAFYVRMIDQTTPDYNFEQISGEPGLRGLFTRKMLERAAASRDDEERQLVMQALYYGMEAIDEGSVCI